MFYDGQDRARLLMAAAISQLFLLKMVGLSLSWDQQWTVPIATGTWEAFRMAIILTELIIDTNFVINNLRSFQMAVWDRMK
jgi:hypothetical protein